MAPLAEEKLRPAGRLGEIVKVAAPPLLAGVKLIASPVLLLMLLPDREGAVTQGESLISQPLAVIALRSDRAAGV